MPETLETSASPESIGTSTSLDIPDKNPSLAEKAKSSPAQQRASDSPSSEDVISRVLHFLSSASTEAIAGCAIALAAATYVILGRIGLVLIGVLGGVILHATWEQDSAQGVIEQKRRENSIEILKRIVDARYGGIEQSGVKSNEQPHFISSDQFLGGYRKQTAEAMNVLVDAIIRDYVKYWYSPILQQDESFPNSCRRTLTSFLFALSSRLSRTRPADKVLDFLTNFSSILIVFINELNVALAANSSYRSPEDAVRTYLSNNPDSNLATIVSHTQQERKFKMVAEDILRNFLDRPAYECDSVRTFLRQILAGVVLEMTLTSCSRSEWINDWIVYLLEGGEPEISHAIDIGMATAPDSGLESISHAKPLEPPQSVRSSMSEIEPRLQKRFSMAEEAMEDAMEEAKRLTQMIAEEEANNSRVMTPGISEVPRFLQKASDANMSKVTDNHAKTSSPSKGTDPAEIGELQETYRDPSTSLERSSSNGTGTPFTSFDQLISTSQPTALQLSESASTSHLLLPLTLFQAKIIVYDDSTQGDKGRIRSKPSIDYLIQVEPKSSQHPGWMIARKYADFETLHEVLRRIATVSGVSGFTGHHGALPSWKTHSKPTLREELEQYLCDSCCYQQLAESEGMKRFLDKDRGQTPTASRGVWPGGLENVGKGMLDVLSIAPKGAAEGGKVVLGGVTGVLGNLSALGQRKTANSSNMSLQQTGRSATSTQSRLDSSNSIGQAPNGRSPEEIARITATGSQSSEVTPIRGKLGRSSVTDIDPDIPNDLRSSMSERSSTSDSDTNGASVVHDGRPSHTLSSLSLVEDRPLQAQESQEISLPPPPSEISDDYGSNHTIPLAFNSRTDSTTTFLRKSTGEDSLIKSQATSSIPPLKSTSDKDLQSTSVEKNKDPSPLSEKETAIAIELLFAVVNELYTLSSAWKFRRTILNAAKTFLLRPGNPSLSSIRTLIQESIIASNTSDAAIAGHIYKIRENTLPTEEELKAWPAESTAEEKEALRIKARRLLVERGMPVALTGVMGQAATGEAMGKIFDCLQTKEVARGLIFGLLLEGVKAITS